MIISLMVISSSTAEFKPGEEVYVTREVMGQLRAFLLGLFAYFFFACIDYRKLRSYAWLLYIGMLILLVGLFFTSPIQNVHRWYKLPLIPFTIQPSEFAKLGVIMMLSFFLERHKAKAHRLSVFLQSSLIVFIPFVLILKQPDLGTALVLLPMMYVMFYFGGVNRKIMIALSMIGVVVFGFVISLFSGILSHEELKPAMTKVLKEYQYERLNPNTYHQQAGQTAIALGRMTGSGWHQSEYTAKKWLPFGYSDSVFCVFVEEFGCLGAFLLLGLFFALIYFSFQVTAVAKDDFGRLLSAGIAVYISMHVIINIGMMVGFLPITGVPLVLITCGGSSVLVTMSALGILQSIYSRRYMF
ncbi:MAG: FtsW/RodA/SpoVE family cell cycle protein [Simkaniaceae bacterium]|nr:FtsW/RodA/SpoVE family cell cycle protein [Simkaniaceae bacterium]MCF7852571.1 FtsW/RodA/SpoVE family cell cycle protein [Simkaniaceae bacterium]